MDMRKKAMLGPTMDNRTLNNRTFIAAENMLSAVKKNSDEIPTLLNSASTYNMQEINKDEPFNINPEEYFRQKLDSKLLCYKCKKLFTEPISCYKCEKIYCFNCLDWELNVHCRCLYCFNIIFKEIAEKVSEDIMTEYDKHELKCPYKKCKEVKKLRDIRDHIADCLYRDDPEDRFRLEHIDKVVCFSSNVRFYYLE